MENISVVCTEYFPSWVQTRELVLGCGNGDGEWKAHWKFQVGHSLTQGRQWLLMNGLTEETGNLRPGMVKGFLATAVAGYRQSNQNELSSWLLLLQSLIQNGWVGDESGLSLVSVRDWFPIKEPFTDSFHSCPSSLSSHALAWFFSLKKTFLPSSPVSRS